MKHLAFKGFGLNFGYLAIPRLTLVVAPARHFQCLREQVVHGTGQTALEIVISMLMPRLLHLNQQLAFPN